MIQILLLRSFSLKYGSFRCWVASWEVYMGMMMVMLLLLLLLLMVMVMIPGGLYLPTNLIQKLPYYIAATNELIHAVENAKHIVHIPKSLEELHCVKYIRMQFG